jgi:alkylated DNA nucleotide flippase Atl1
VNAANWKRAAKRWRRIALTGDKQRSRQSEQLRRAGVRIGVDGRVSLELAPRTGGGQEGAGR